MRDFHWKSLYKSLAYYLGFGDMADPKLDANYQRSANSVFCHAFSILVS